MVRDIGRTHAQKDWQRRRIKEILTFASIDLVGCKMSEKCHDARVNIIPHISAVQASVAVKLLRHRANMYISYPVPEHRYDIHVGAQGDPGPAGGVFWRQHLGRKVRISPTDISKTMLWGASWRYKTPRNALWTTPVKVLPAACRVFPRPSCRSCRGAVFCAN